jgi:hypothetical protein
MSDELPPPPLRLRPRKRDEEGTSPAVPVAPVDEVPATASVTTAEVPLAAVADSAPGRFRLKPKIVQTAEELPAGVPPADSGAAAFAVAQSTLPIPEVAAESTEAPRVKLKLSALGASAVAPVVGPEMAAELPPTPPLVAAEAVANVGDMPLSAPPAVAPLSTAPSSVDLPLAPTVKKLVPPPLPGTKSLAVKPKAANGSRRVLWVVLGLVVLIGGAGAYYFLVMDSAPPPESVVTRHLPPAVPVVPQKAVQPAPTPALPAPPAAEVLAIAPLPTTAVMGEGDAASAPAKVKPKAASIPVMTPAFRQWLEGVRINGVTMSSGNVPRVIINGRLVRPGDTVDNALGIVYDSIDLERKEVLFRNQAGVVARKAY